MCISIYISCYSSSLAAPAQLKKKSDTHGTRSVTIAQRRRGCSLSRVRVNG